jgi:hypothetical protein
VLKKNPHRFVTIDETAFNSKTIPVIGICSQRPALLFVGAFIDAVALTAKSARWRLLRN